MTTGISIPQGVWAIGSHLEGAAEAEAWLTSAEPAAAVTLRHPSCDPREALRALKSMTSQQDFVATHGMADLAQTAKAHAVIGGFRSLPLPVYKKRFPDLLLGASTHSAEEAQAAVASGADFLLFGPVWDTPEKHGILQARGVETLQSICASYKLPIIAIGGIQSTQQVMACKLAGAHAVAVLRAAKDLTSMTDLRRAWRG